MRRNPHFNVSRPRGCGQCVGTLIQYYITDNEKEKAIIADKNTLKDADLAKKKTDLDEVAKKKLFSLFHV